MSELQLVDAKDAEGFVKIRATHFDADMKPTAYEYDWHGGNLCSLSFDFLENIDLHVIWWDRKRGFKGMILGDLIQIGPYILEVLAVDFKQNIVRCRRARAKEEATK